MNKEIQVFDQEEPFKVPEFEYNKDIDFNGDYDTKMKNSKQQKRYGTIEVPDQMIMYAAMNKNKKGKSLKQLAKNIFKK